MKKYKFLFLLLFSFFIFLPKDTYAIQPSTNGYGCKTEIDGVSSCSGLSQFTFPNGEGGIGLTLNALTPYRFVTLDFYNQSFCAGENTGGTWKGWIWFNEPIIRNYVYDLNDIIVRQGSQTFNCFYSKSGDYGISFLCTIPNSISNSTISFDIGFGGYEWRSNSNVGVGVYTTGTQTCQLNTGSIISNDNINTNKVIENNNWNTNKVIESNEKIKQEQEKTNEELGELNDNLTSEEAPDLDALEDSAGWLPPGPVDSILNLPLTFFNNLISNLSKTCQPVDIPLPYVSKNLTLPCISTLYEQIGATTFLNWVGLIVGTIILYNYFLSLYKWIDDTIQMKDNSVDDWGGV